MFDVQGSMFRVQCSGSGFEVVGANQVFLIIFKRIRLIAF